MRTTDVPVAPAIAWGISVSLHAGCPRPASDVRALDGRLSYLRTHDASFHDQLTEPLAVDEEYVAFCVDDNNQAWLQNHCQALACRVNGAELRPGERRTLADRDDITVGLTRLTVIRADSTQQWDAWTAASADVSVSDPDAALAALRALDPPQRGRQAFRYGDLPRSHSTPENEAPLPIAQDPLAALAVEFDHAIAGTHQGLGALPVIEQNLTQRLPAPPNPFDHTDNASTRTRMLLEGLLPESTDIDGILADMDDFDEQALFSAPTTQEVLSLLADVQEDRGPLSTLATLSRREHHELSIDSHFEQAPTPGAGPDHRHNDDTP